MKWINCEDKLPPKFDAVCRKKGYIDLLDSADFYAAVNKIVWKNWEWLDEESPTLESDAVEMVLGILDENYQAQIAGYYNDDKTDEERKIRNAVIEEYKDLIEIFKFRQAKQQSNKVK